MVVVDHAPEVVLWQLHLLEKHVAACIVNVGAGFDLENGQESATQGHANTAARAVGVEDSACDGDNLACDHWRVSRTIASDLQEAVQAGRGDDCFAAARGVGVA